MLLLISQSVVSDSSRLHGLQHAWLYHPSPSTSLLKLMSTEWVIPANQLILYHSLLLHSVFTSTRGFSIGSALHIRWPKYQSFRLNIRPSNEYPRLISCRTDWFDLLAVQGTLKSLLKHHSSKASLLQCSVFFMVQLLHLCMTSGKTLALTLRTFVDKVSAL